MKERKKRIYEAVDYTAPEFTRCWTCEKATGGCTWSHFAESVEGWEARKTYIPANGEYAESYFVIECPEYRKDERI